MKGGDLMQATKTCEVCGKVHTIVNTTQTVCVKCGGRLVSKANVKK